jgi:hypothetical protein
MRHRIWFAVAALQAAVLVGDTNGSPTLRLRAEMDGAPGWSAGCWIDPFGIQRCRPHRPSRSGVAFEASAVCIGRSGDSLVFLTAGHTFRNRPPRVSVLHDGESIAAFQVRVCQQYDFATFEIPFRKSIDCAPLLYELPLGSDASAQGWGAGRCRTIDGSIDRRWFRDVTTGTQLGSFASVEPITEGDSGGGIFTRSGELTDRTANGTFANVAPTRNS